MDEADITDAENNTDEQTYDTDKSGTLTWGTYASSYWDEAAGTLTKDAKAIGETETLPTHYADGYVVYYWLSEDSTDPAGDMSAYDAYQADYLAYEPFILIEDGEPVPYDRTVVENVGIRYGLPDTICLMLAADGSIEEAWYTDADGEKVSLDPGAFAAIGSNGTLTGSCSGAVTFVTLYCGCDDCVALRAAMEEGGDTYTGDAPFSLVPRTEPPLISGAFSQR